MKKQTSSLYYLNNWATYKHGFMYPIGNSIVGKVRIRIIGQARRFFDESRWMLSPMYREVEALCGRE